MNLNNQLTNTEKIFFRYLKERKRFPDSIPILIISAHPDDEVIGAGSILNRMKNVKIIHVTNGAPADNIDAIKNGFKNVKEYSAARFREFDSVLEMLNIHKENHISLNIPDQQVIYKLKELISLLYDLISKYKPYTIITHAYEGGHPDHDSTCFAVHSVCSQLIEEKESPPLIIEMALYNGVKGFLETNEFIPHPEHEIVKLILNENEQRLKKEMLRNFATQKEVIKYFPVVQEEYRISPDYNFFEPPHSGIIYYDNFDWGIKSRNWNKTVKNFLEHRMIKENLEKLENRNY